MAKACHHSTLGHRDLTTSDLRYLSWNSHRRYQRAQIHHRDRQA